MDDHTIRPPLARAPLLAAGAAALALAFAACSTGGTTPTVPGNLASVAIPTMPPDDLASGAASCIDPETMVIIDKLRAPGADVPALLAQNKDALLRGLGDLESSDPKTREWRDALLSALQRNDMTAAAAQVAVLAAGEVTITPC